MSATYQSLLLVAFKKSEAGYVRDKELAYWLAKARMSYCELSDLTPSIGRGLAIMLSLGAEAVENKHGIHRYL